MVQKNECTPGTVEYNCAMVKLHGISSWKWIDRQDGELTEFLAMAHMDTYGTYVHQTQVQKESIFLIHLASESVTICVARIC